MRYLIPAFAILAMAAPPLAAKAQTAAPTTQQNSVKPQIPSQPAPAQPAPKSNRLAKRFAAANTTHDGRLTLDQAKSAKWRQVVKRFGKIDADSKGYVTEQEIRTAAAQARSAKTGPANKT